MGFLDRSIFEASKKRAVGEYYVRAKEARKKTAYQEYQKKAEKKEFKKEFAREEINKDRKKAVKGLNKFFFG